MMTVLELYNELKKEIDKGHADLPIMIHDSVNDGDYGYTEMNELNNTTYYSKTSYWPEHIEIGRY